MDRLFFVDPIKLFNFSTRPGKTCISAPKCPCNSTFGRVALFTWTKTLCFLINLMTREERKHPTNRTSRKFLLVFKLTSPSNANSGSAWFAFFPPSEGALGFLFHPVSRGKINIYTSILRHLRLPLAVPLRWG